MDAEYSFAGAHLKRLAIPDAADRHWHELEGTTEEPLLAEAVLLHPNSKSSLCGTFSRPPAWNRYKASFPIQTPMGNIMVFGRRLVAGFRRQRTAKPRGERWGSYPLFPSIDSAKSGGGSTV